jgi:hypothetical protein
MLCNGELQDPEKASVIPCEYWDKFNKADAKRVLMLATSELVEGATEEDRLNVLQAFMSQNGIDCFMRGLSLGYRAFGHKEASSNAIEVNDKLVNVHIVLLLASILQNFGPDVLERYLTIEDEDEEGTDND